MNWILTDLACASIGVHTVRCQMSILTKDGLTTICSRNNIKAVFYHPGEQGEFEEHLMRCIPEAFREKTEECVVNPQANIKKKAERAEKNTGDISGYRSEDKTNKGTAETSMLNVKYLIRLCPTTTKNAAIDLSSLFIQGGSLDQVHELKKTMNPESIYTVYMTSGSTGFPKAIPYTHFENYHFLQH